MISELVGEGPGRRVSQPPASLVMPCNVCGKTDSIKRCEPCTAVGYCGKGHQKADWQVYRKVCVSKSWQSG